MSSKQLEVIQTRNTLKKIGIDVLGFLWGKGEPDFPGLADWQFYVLNYKQRGDQKMAKKYLAVVEQHSICRQWAFIAHNLQADCPKFCTEPVDNVGQSIPVY